MNSFKHKISPNPEGLGLGLNTYITPRFSGVKSFGIMPFAKVYIKTVNDSIIRLG